MYELIMKNKVATFLFILSLLPYPIAMAIFMNWREIIHDGYSVMIALLIMSLLLSPIVISLWWFASWIVGVTMGLPKKVGKSYETNLIYSAWASFISVGSLFSFLFAILWLLLSIKFNWTFKTFVILTLITPLSRIIFAILDYIYIKLKIRNKT